jgi:Dyp-type peroxidase family
MPAIDQNDVAHDSLLSSIQGNILKGHGRDYTANIFIEFHPDQIGKATAWVNKFAEEKVTSAKKQLAETARFKRHKIPGGLFAGLYLSWAGYRYFNIAERPEEENSSFALGMRGADLKDPLPATWDPVFRDLSIHAMVLLAHDDKLTLDKEVAELIDDIRELTLQSGLDDKEIAKFMSKKIGIEYGHAIRNANGDGLEHFGYVDGISQPLFFKDEVEQNCKDRVPNNSDPLWDPEADLELVLSPDYEKSATYGSFFVFRKLEQDVRAFKVAERELALKIGLPLDEVELAGAMLVGRFEDGTPVTIYGDEGMIGGGNANNFNYDSDAQGLKCPFHGHVRKTNPRGAGNKNITVAADKKHIMARRGIPYGMRDVSTEFDCQPEQFPTGTGIGLLFQSFQASIKDQFEFIQKNWANDANFPGTNPARHTGIDPLIGQKEASGDSEYNWPVGHGGPKSVNLAFPQLVTMKGGEYFFAPSLTTLQAFGNNQVRGGEA